MRMTQTRRVGQKEVSLPDHITPLPQVVIDVVSALRDSAVRVVACGIDPRDGFLYVVTGNADVRFVKPGSRIAPTSAYPSHDGSTIGLTLSGDDKLHSVSSDLTLSRSESCFSALSSLTVNDTYMGDLAFEAVFPKEHRDADQTESPEENRI